MKTVLLAIDGERPSRQALDYAVGLCRQMKARLSILQVIGAGKRALNETILCDKVKNIRNMAEEAMIEITFAESGERYKTHTFSKRPNKSYPDCLKKEKANVFIDDLQVIRGNTAKEISGYLRSHNEVVLTVYDSSDNNTGKQKKNDSAAPKKISEKIKVPMVMIKR